jgi:aspartate dehydrogenase
MKVCIIGCGFIGTTLANAMEDMDEIETIYVTDKTVGKASSLTDCKKVVFKEDIAEILDDIELVVEAASQGAVHQYAPAILGYGKDILVMSVGAFADDELWKKCTMLAKENGCKIFLPTGALSGIDGLSSAAVGKLEEVTLMSTKPVLALKDNAYLKEKGLTIEALEAPMVVFEGSARDAARYFPKTSNVAATLSLAGLGFDKTRVKIIADPKTDRNTHEVFVKGDFGEMRAVVSNIPSPSNPKTSILAARSAISGMNKITGVVWVGL